jgi:CheY-like chemotaxis protein
MQTRYWQVSFLGETIREHESNLGSGKILEVNIADTELDQTLQTRAWVREPHGMLMNTTIESRGRSGQPPHRAGERFRMFQKSDGAADNFRARTAGPAVREGDGLEAVPASRAILLLEDERQTRELAKVCLEIQGYTVLQTDSPAGAIDFWKKWPGRIQMLITDSGIFGIIGARLASLLTQEKPELKVLFTTEQPNRHISQMRETNPNVYLLPKPYPIKLLAETVNAVLSLNRENVIS